MVSWIAAPVRADAPVGSPVLDASALDARCRPLAVLPGDARALEPLLDAYISIANCEAGARLDALHLAPEATSADAVDNALRPSIAMLDVVIRNGDLARRIIAEHAKGELYIAANVRLLASAGTIRPGISAKAQAEHYAKVREADRLAETWRRLAVDAYADAARMGNSDPKLVEGNPVVAAAVADSRREQAIEVAAR